MPSSELKITSGLSLFDCSDHYAFLGVPLHSEQKVIRKRYLTIARKLHPDSIRDGVDKQTASTLLSKLINPSYEFLSQPSQMEEYKILLKLVGQRYAQELNQFRLKSEEAQDLLQSADFEATYLKYWETLAQQQFEQLPRYLDVTAILSELNLVYLYRQDGAPAVARSASSPAPPPAPAATTGSQPINNPQATSSTSVSAVGGTARPAPGAAEPDRKINYSLVDQYYRRAEELIAKSCYLEAVRELKEVVEGPNPIDPKNSKVYTLLGDIYKQHMKQPVMAKPFYMRALKADPNNAEAKRQLSEISAAQPRAGAKSQTASETKDKKKSGLFGFLSRKK